MRCPKCGAFMEEGKDVCFMCGTNAKTYVPENTTNNYNTNSNFGSGNDFRSPNGNFNNQNVPQNNFNDYKKAEIAPLKNEDKDIFDRYHEHKTIINCVLIICFVLIIVLIGYKYYKYKSTPVDIEPVVQNLYFEVDDSLEAVSSSSGTLSYIKSGDKGNACSITISYGTSSSDDHVEEYFDAVRSSLEPERDDSGNIIDESDIYTESESSMSVNDATWYYLNIFYNTDSDGTDSESSNLVLKYKYLTSIYKGYYYDIILVNNSNDSVCNASLDNFAKSLEFIET